MGRNVMIFGTDSLNSKHSANKTQKILILGRDPIQKINDTTIYAEKVHSPNFSVENKTDNDSYLFVNDKEVTKSKANYSEIKPHPLTLGSI